MAYAEQGADYIAFGSTGFSASETIADQAAEFISWWSELFEVPCVAWGLDDLDQIASMAKCGSDFVAVGDFIWRHAAGPRAAVAEINAVLDRVADTA